MKRGDLAVPTGKSVRLSDFDAADKCGYKDKSEARGKLKADIERLRRQQDLLYASRAYALLIILQGMDAAGKDGVIKHVMSGLNPQGVDVHPFKQPSEEELNHDFLWRCIKVLPERGRIGIFNRSYYEEVLITRVNPGLLSDEHIVLSDVTSDFWKQRFDDIRRFENYLLRNGTLVLKFFLHISKDEQRKRLLKRVQTPDKYWKFSGTDLEVRERWQPYQDAYAEMLSATSAPGTPWYIIPADHKWVARVLVADIVAGGLEELGLVYPRPDERQTQAINAAREHLKEEK